MTIHIYQNDLPENLLKEQPSIVAIDTEAMGLKPHRDPLCLVQLSFGDDIAHLVHFPDRDYDSAKNLKNLLENPKILKLFHFARFDVMILNYALKVWTENIYCTKIASKLCRTYTDRHGLKDLCRALLDIDISKQEQTSDWGRKNLTESQMKYAANDVFHLHALKEKLDALLNREGRTELAQACFQFLPHRTQLDVMVSDQHDIFAH